MTITKRIELSNNDVSIYASALERFLDTVRNKQPVGEQQFKNIHDNCIEMSAYIGQTSELDTR